MRMSTFEDNISDQFSVNRPISPHSTVIQLEKFSTGNRHFCAQLLGTFGDYISWGGIYIRSRLKLSYNWYYVHVFIDFTTLVVRAPEKQMKSYRDC